MKLLKEKIEFIKENAEKVVIRIFGSKESMALLNNKTIRQYYSLDEIKIVIILLDKSFKINTIELILISCF